MRPFAPTTLTVALIAVAGTIASVAYAAGAAGPMVVFGHSDANLAARDAWLQLPIHAVIAAAVVLTTYGPVARLARDLALGLSLVLALWGLMLTVYVIAGLRSMGTDASDVAVAITLLFLYVAVLRLSWISSISPSIGLRVGGLPRRRE